VRGTTRVFGSAIVADLAKIAGHAQVACKSVVKDNALISGSERILGQEIGGNTAIS
jgi:hypothetical protein